MRFFIPRDSDLLTSVIEASYEVHSYYEPPITVTKILRSQTKGSDDSNNPHRWWNKGGDQKEKNRDIGSITSAIVARAALLVVETVADRW